MYRDTYEPVNESAVHSRWSMSTVGLMCILCTGTLVSCAVFSYAVDGFRLYWIGDVDLLHHGSNKEECVKEKWPAVGLPSMLRVKELRAWPNVFFRLAIYCTITVRIFAAFCYKYLPHGPRSWVFVTNLLTELLVPVCVVELCALALSVTITIRMDHRDHLNAVLLVFYFFALLHMFILLMLQTARDGKRKLDSILFGIRLLCLAVFAATVPSVIGHHLEFLTVLTCHPIVPTPYAMAEYSALVSNAIFHVIAVYDLRHIQLVIGAQEADLCVQVDERFIDEYQIDQERWRFLTVKAK